MAAAAVAIGAAGLALQVYSIYDARVQAKNIAAQKRTAAEFTASQLEVQAGQEQAASQRGRLQEERQSKLVQSRALALAAASGASASDPTTIRTIAGIASEGAYRQHVALYQGEESARKLRIAAAADRVSGDIAAGATLASARGFELATAGSALGQASSMFARFGYGSPASVVRTSPVGDPYLDAGSAPRSYG